MTDIARRLTAKQEAFCQFYVVLNNGAQAAIKSGYAVASAKAIACENLTKPYLAARIAEISANLPIDPDIASVEERKRRLTEIYRANLIDFQGKDGEPTLSKDIPHHTAASEYSVSTTFTKIGEAKVTKSIKLLNPISAIQEHNKMERIGATDTVINFNEIKVMVVREESRALTEVKDAIE